MPEVSTALREQIRSRAGGRCEYCRMPEGVALARHEVDHVVAAKHGGETSFDNLALCCTRCNRYKGTDLSSIDPDTGEIERLFHPRRDQWLDHFRMQGGTIQALTGVGRVTIRLLQLNREERVLERNVMMRIGAIPG